MSYQFQLIIHTVIFMDSAFLKIAAKIFLSTTHHMIKVMITIVKCYFAYTRISL